MFETVSFHLVKPCNYSCKFCYATYNSFKVGQQLDSIDVMIILKKLKDAGLQKVTFAGGEPMLYKFLPAVIIYAKQIGLTTSIITNGSLISHQFLDDMRPYLDWIGLSVDSINDELNQQIGRVSNKGKVLNYYDLVEVINVFGYKLKINTVVNSINEYEVMRDFIDFSGTTRWKVFDTLRVEGQNEEQFEAIKSTDFNGFVINNAHESMVVENNDLMTASYLLIDPLGRFYENWGADIKKSDSLVTHSVEHCLNQISLDRNKFLERGGVYNW